MGWVHKFESFVKNKNSLDFKEKGTPYHPCFSDTGIGLKKILKGGLYPNRELFLP